ncbi:MAG: succinate--CoA ligase subunit alpha [Candidatus Riflebacteria bacterium]|nr:succinate--CoA ligase subunit alpha [Candidatus Riflebacteria bacterium]
MSIIINKKSRIVVQGAAGVEGQFHMKQCLEYSPNIVAGVDPALKTDTVVGVPAYTNLKEACEKHKPDTSIIFVPAPYCFDAIIEAVSLGIKTLIVITEGIPVNDMVKVKQYIRGKGITMIGPNCPGLISVGECKLGIMPAHIHKQGNVGVISRSGTLTYEVVQALTNAGIGQSTCVGIGGDPIQGSNFVDILRLFKNDPETKAVVLIGEIGGTEEEKAAAYVASELGKPAVAFIAGKTAPAEKRMGHAGAIISGGKGTAASKIKALEDANIRVANVPIEIADLVKKIL